MIESRGAFEQWKRLSAWERRVFVAAYFLLPGISLSLRFRGLAATRRTLEKRRGTVDPHDDTLLDNVADDVARLLKSAAERQPFEMKCLTRSLTLWYLLGRMGVPSEVRIGVTKIDGVFDAHAWVESGGRIILDTHEVVDQYAAII